MELNPQQTAAAAYSGDARNILVTAGAGCGKTRTLIARAVHLARSGADVSRLLLMTFTNRAAREMKIRLKREIGPLSGKIQAGTFHSFCLKAIATLPKSFDATGLNVIDGDDQKALMTVARNNLVHSMDGSRARKTPKAAELLKFHSYSRNTCQTPEAYLPEFTDMEPEQATLCCRIFDEYRRLKTERGYLDYDDLLWCFSEALDRKPDLRRDLTGLFDEVLVDEMQDTNPLQFRILRHFASERVRLFCVGDPAQSIYRFRGAEFQYIHRFGELFPESTVLRLTENYRSNQEILDLGNWLLAGSPFDYGEGLHAARGACGLLPVLHDFDGVAEEAEWVADAIEERRSADIPYSDMMVLVRTSFDAKPFEAEFIRRSIPYRYIGGTKITESAHVRDVMSLLRVVRNRRDDLAWMRYLQLWPRVGKVRAGKFLEVMQAAEDGDFMRVVTERFGPEHPAVTALAGALPLAGRPRACVSAATASLSGILSEHYDRWDRRRQDLDLLVSVAGRYDSLSDFIDDFTLEPMTNTEIHKLEENDTVTLITVHSAKGTEARICFVAGAGPGTYPHIRSFGDPDAEEEERRVLYVAVTRAMDELHLSRSMERRGAFFMLNTPTRGEEYFLAEVPENLALREAHGGKPRTSGGLSALKDRY